MEWSDILYIEHTCTVHVDTVEGNFRGAIFSCISLVKQKTQFFYPRNVCALCYAINATSMARKFTMNCRN